MKNEIIAKLKLEYPTLTKGEDDRTIVLSAEEYDLVISSWADEEIRKQAEEQAKAEAQAKRQALLDKLGITEEEARLLLGGN